MLHYLHLLKTRWRYPVCCPEDIASALGVSLSNHICFEELVAQLTNKGYHASSLEKYMPREGAEAVFSHAQCVERFQNMTLVSFYFSEGWMEFSLYFDSNERLRRLYLQHQYIPSQLGIEIALKQPNWVPAPAIGHSRQSISECEMA
jgi:hypothetical protein